MVNIEQLKQGIGVYADREIVNRLPNGTLKKVLVGSAIAIALKNSVEPFLNGEISSALGICKDGMVDTELLRDTIKSQMPPDGLRVTLPMVDVNLTFSQSDIDKMYSDIEGV